MLFENQAGLWAFLALVPFFILYMVRPKPQDRVIPSLMFLIKDNKKSSRNSFLRRFVQNLLFFLQLLIICLLAISVAAPYMVIPYDVTSENTVIIIDASASMQAGSPATRFENAVKEAKNALSGRNSIILAENVPIIMLEEENTDAALEVLSKIKPKATTTNLGDAMLGAKNDILKDKPGRIVVISDFSNIDGPDLEVVKKKLIEDDLAVDFIDVSDKTDNIGMVKMDISKHTMKVYVKNFMEQEKSVTLKLAQNGKVVSTSDQVKILPGSIETFLFDEVPAGVSEVRLEPKDSFMLDNTLYISTPLKSQIDVMLITNEQGSNLQLAMESSKDIKLDVVDLFKSPALNFNTKDENIKPYEHDLVIIHKINRPGERGGMLLSGFTDIANYVKKGGKVILTANENSKAAGLEQVLNSLELVKLYDMAGSPDKVCIDIINEFTSYFEDDICFASLPKYYMAEQLKDTVTVASTTGKVPVISLKDISGGKAAYYGIIDDSSDFKSLPSYPIFWNKLINYMAGSESASEYNYVTGRVLNLDAQTIQTPSGTIEASSLYLDEAGVYSLKEKKIAANLLDEAESDLRTADIEKEKQKESVVEKDTKEHNLPLAPLAMLLVFLLLLGETFYVKARGDL